MRSKTSDAALVHITKNIRLCREFITGMTYEAFVDDQRTVYATTRCLEIICEASRRLSQDIKDCYPEIPWADIAGAGNIYRHDYEDVREKTLWKTIHERLDELLIVVEREIEVSEKKDEQN